MHVRVSHVQKHCSDDTVVHEVFMILHLKPAFQDELAIILLPFHQVPEHSISSCGYSCIDFMSASLSWLVFRHLYVCECMHVRTRLNKRVAGLLNCFNDLRTVGNIYLCTYNIWMQVLCVCTTAARRHCRLC